jgi:hypothetical protein
VLDLVFCIGDEVAVGLPKLSRLKDVSVNVSLLFTLVMVDVKKDLDRTPMQLSLVCKYSLKSMDWLLRSCVILWTDEGTR